MNKVEQFFKAIGEGNKDQVQSLLAEEATLASARNADGVSAILFALYSGKTDYADLLTPLKAELDIFESTALDDTKSLEAIVTANKDAVNSYSADGFTPLHLACFFGNVAVAKVLFENGAEPNSVSKNGAGLHPINSAAACRDLDAALGLVYLLLKHGADIQAAQRGGYSALHSASANGNVKLVKLLLSRGADATMKAENGKTPLDFARDREKEGVVAILTH